MPRLRPRVRLAALGLKLVGVVVGGGVLAMSLGFAYNELTHLAATGAYGPGDVVVILAETAVALSGIALIAQLPESLRARFRRIPHAPERKKPVYGFGTMLAVGIGATLGSPLFILIPQNVVSYEVISLLSLLLAAALSVAMAKVYSDMYKETAFLGLEGVGGPSFTKVAVGPRTVRYFVSRLSMWVSNTALAAYSQIVLLIFILNPAYLPSVLGSYGLSPLLSQVLLYTIAGAFIGWTAVNVFFEKRYLRLLGAVQVAMTGLLLLILVYHSLVLGSAGSWDLSGLGGTLGAGWLPALVVNTGYLYLLFFGFQEIQSLERDARERSTIPVVSWIRKGYTVGKTTYLGIAMVTSVVVASAVNILYGIAVFSSHTPLGGSAIPALFLAGRLLGPGEELLMAVAFLIATVTTFVPAFLAAARHLSALGEDGYIPSSLANLSWVFTIVAIFLLAISNQDFLVNITDFMVLISLGIITLSAIWLRKRTGGGLRGGRFLPLLVGASCFVFGGAVYFSPSGGTVVVFGSMAVIFAYLIFDVIELGTLGAQIFLSVFGLVSILALATFRHVVYVHGIVLGLTQEAGVGPDWALAWGLLLASLMLMANVLLDVKVLGRTST